MKVEVIDDGRGFDPEAATEGFGLLGMRERVGLAHGQLTVESEPGSTVVRATVPAGSAASARAS